MAWPKAAARVRGRRSTDFWRRVSHAAAMGPLQPSPIDRVLHNHALEYSPAFMMLDFMTPAVLALSAQSRQLQPAAARAGAVGRLRPAARAGAGQAVPVGDQRPHRQGQDLHQPGDHVRGGDGLGLPAVHVPGGRDRRRGLLGRRLHGQPRHLPADLPLRQPGRGRRPHQPAAAARRSRAAPPRS